METCPLSRRSLLAGFGATAAALAIRPAAARDSAFDWTAVKLLDGEDRPFHVGQSAKPLTLIKLWANWCTACLRELGTVEAIAASVGAGNIDIVLVSHPDDWTRNQEIAGRHNLTIRCARPSSENSPAVLQAGLLTGDNMFYVPRSLLFSRQHQAVVWSHTGALDWTRPETAAPIRRWIA